MVKVKDSTMDKLKENINFQCQTQNQQEDLGEDCPGIKLNCLCLEILERFCYFGDIIQPRRGAVDSVITRVRME